MAAATLPASPPTPDWLNAAAKGDAASEPERIALRTAPPARGPAEPKKPDPMPRIKRIDPPAEPAAVGNLDRPRYPSRIMIPETALMCAVAVLWITAVVPNLPLVLQTWEVYVSIPGALGLFQFVRWIFRHFGGGYRLTARQILRTAPGPIPDPDPIELSQITAVKVKRTMLERFLCAGCLRLSFERDAQDEIVLGPIGRPSHRAELIEKAVQAAREGNVVSGRVGA